MRLCYLIFFITYSLSLSAQSPSSSKISEKKKIDVQKLVRLQPRTTTSNSTKYPQIPLSVADSSFSFQTSSPEIKVVDSRGVPTLIRGTVNKTFSASRSSSKPSPYQYLNTIKASIQIKEPEKEFAIKEEKVDELGQRHIKLQQVHNGIEVYGGEVWLHASKEQEIDLFMGRHFPTPTLVSFQPSIDAKKATHIALDDVSQFTTVTDHEDTNPSPFFYKHENEAKLVIYHVEKDAEKEHLAWALTIHPNNVSHWNYFIDAHTGEVLQHYSTLCQLDHKVNRIKNDAPVVSNIGAYSFSGPESTQAPDLNGNPRNINTYELNGTYYMLDVSRPMFDARSSNLPNEPVGAVWTLDAQNTSPATRSFQPTHITANNNNWRTNLGALGVSAHSNASITYEYFLDTHGRNSINGRGGNIISFINVSEEDGSSMENAFWDGNYIYYGNGGSSFRELARSLDVAGHEISHGVVQNTANLEYFGESGAMNESFADIFAVTITRDNWLIGEEVVNTQTFTGGALRNLADPHNGGTRLGHPGWQPNHVSEQFRGREDNGGVHINSGIVNHAFYLYSTDEAMGSNVVDNISRTEKIYYRALTNYLTSRSDFQDLRTAVILSARDLHGSNSVEVSAAASAFASVGITSPSVDAILDIEAPTMDTPPAEIDANEGEEYILFTNESGNGLYILQINTGQIIQISNSTVLSKPSITDNGREIIFVTQENTLKQILLDWSANNIVEEELFISEESVWRNATISRDGRRFAGLLVEGAFSSIPDNVIYVQDFELDVTDPDNSAQLFPLYNPTYTTGITTGTVQYADVIEFDISGNKILYDALNTIEGSFGSSELSYWDIGLLTVWDEATNFWISDRENNIQKVFTNIPREDSVGNPTFSKNSPDVIAFEYVENFNDDDRTNDRFIVFGANIRTNRLDSIFSNNIPNVPNYSTQDDFIIFNLMDAQNQFNGNIILAAKALTDNKISAQNDDVFLAAQNTGGAQNGVWFAIGERNLNQTTSTYETIPNITNLLVHPNPFHNQMNLNFSLDTSMDLNIVVSDILGQRLYEQAYKALQGNNEFLLQLPQLQSGNYIINIFSDKGVISKKVVKL